MARPTMTFKKSGRTMFINGPADNFPHTVLPVNGAEPNLVQNESLRNTLHKMDVIDPNQRPGPGMTFSPKASIPYKKAPYTA